jgi:hypothetical protein
MSPGGTVERGAVSWWQYHPESGAEAFGYSGKSGATLDKVPSDLDASKFRMVPYDCNNMQPPFGLLYQ